MKQSNRDLHIEMWQWLVDNPDRNKKEWPRWDRNGGDIPCFIAMCFACKEAKETLGDDDDIFDDDYCAFCPVDWGGEGVECIDDETSYEVWRYKTRLSDSKQRKRLAIEIRDAWPKDK